MKKKERLVNKIRRLVKQAGLPRYIHRFGPKKFLFWQLCLGLLIKEIFRLSYRRAMKFLIEFYDIKLHWTTLQKFRKRVSLHIWNNLLNSTLGNKIAVAAIDGTSLQRSSPSMHYLKRIDRTKISVPVYLNAIVDVIKRKFVAVRHHASKSGEVKDAYYLYKKSNEIDLILMDKAYDSEKLHRFFREQGTYSIAPVKKNWSKGQYRKQLKDCFDHSLYWQRNLVECLFSALKRLFGHNLRGLSARTQRAEIYMRMIAYNLGARIMEIFY
jgi:transposase